VKEKRSNGNLVGGNLEKGAIRGMGNSKYEKLMNSNDIEWKGFTRTSFQIAGYHKNVR